MMITSHASLDIAVKATRDGAYDFVPKPFTPQELKASIENITKHLFLKRMTKKLNKEGKSIRFQFLSVLSHELKTPLNAIEGYLHMIQEKQLGNTLEDYEAVINRSLERVKGMRNMIMDMLDLTQIESGKKKRELSKINIVPFALAAIDSMRPYAIQKEVKVNIHSHGAVYMTADADELEIIFNNLISNAVKYNKPGGSVDCYIGEANGLITISVADTGIGIAKDDLVNIFNEFVRIKNEKTKNISGSGLGLSIVRKLAEFYNGKVSIVSEPDKGTQVIVELTAEIKEDKAL
jgi:signal transduction histidine kinase